LVRSAECFGSIAESVSVEGRANNSHKKNINKHVHIGEELSHSTETGDEEWNMAQSKGTYLVSD